MGKQDSILSQQNDSILVERAEKNSLFYNHSLKPIHTTPVFNAAKPSYWQGILLFVIFSIYVLTKVSEPRKIVKIFLSVFSLQEARQLFREEFRLTKRLSIFLALGFILVAAFLIQIINHYFGLILDECTTFNQYLFFVALIVISYTVKFLANHILAFITMSKDLEREYLFNVVVFNQTLGIILFPFVIAMQFTTYPSEWFLYPAIIICLGFYILRLFRGFIISVAEQNIGIIYIFLYLCALEILPLLILIKFLLTNF